MTNDVRDIYWTTAPTELGYVVRARINDGFTGNQAGMERHFAFWELKPPSRCWIDLERMQNRLMKFVNG